jgi:hypothetical protein
MSLLSCFLGYFGAFCGKRRALGVKGGTDGLRKRFADNRGFGMNELLGIAAALIIAAFIIIPSLQTFANTVMAGLTTWWTNTIHARLFPTSLS